ncbi:MAG: DUF3566 domain-containing protein [Methanoregula sp.]
MPVLHSIDILSVAKIGALFGLVMGIVWGIFYGMLAAAMLGRLAPGFGAFGGIVLLIIMPVCGVIMGFIMGAVHAFLYNVFAGWVGGIRLELKE